MWFIFWMNHLSALPSEVGGWEEEVVQLVKYLPCKRETEFRFPAPR